MIWLALTIIALAILILLACLGSLFRHMKELVEIIATQEEAITGLVRIADIQNTNFQLIRSHLEMTANNTIH